MGGSKFYGVNIFRSQLFLAGGLGLPQENLEIGSAPGAILGLF